MFNLQQFIANHVTHRSASMFVADIECNRATLQAEIEDKSVCVIGGAGSIGSSFIKAMLRFKPKRWWWWTLTRMDLLNWCAMCAALKGSTVPTSSAAIHSTLPTPSLSVFPRRKGL